MSKPSLSLQQKIYWAVRDAIIEGMTVDEFRQQCAEAWDACLVDDRTSAKKDWEVSR